MVGVAIRIFCFQRVVVERGLGLEGRVQGRLGGHEADDEIGSFAALELVLVALRGEFRDVVADLARVAQQLALAARFVLGFEHLEVGVERYLGVDHDAAVPRQHHHRVGAQQPILAVQRLLHDEVDVLGHPGDLDAALQLHLAPFAARLRLAQRLDQGAGLRPEVAEADLHLVEQRLHRPVGGARGRGPGSRPRARSASGSRRSARSAGGTRLRASAAPPRTPARRFCATPRSSAAGRRPPSRSLPGSPARGRAPAAPPRAAGPAARRAARRRAGRRRWRAQWSPDRC